MIPIRNLAISGVDTIEKANIVCEIVGDSPNLYAPNKKWYFDDGYGKKFMYNWYGQENNPNFKNCTQMTYEEFIGKYGDGK